MNAPPGLRRLPRATPIREHALDELRFIRRAMERASALTAFPGWGQVAIGVTAFPATVLAARANSAERWLQVWLAEAVLAVGIGAAAMALKARRLGTPLFGPAGRRFALSFSLPVVAGAVLTAALARAHAVAPLPGLWMLLYGVAIAAGGAFSVAAVRAMGYSFMAAGAFTLFAPPGWRDVLLAAGFGGLHVGFGLWIAGRHGG